MAKRRAWYRSWPVDLAVRLLYGCGFLHLVGLCRRWFGRKRLVILLYHRLARPGGDTAFGRVELDGAVSVDRFERHLKILRWFGEPLSLDRAYDRLHDSHDPARTLISITFDDGYRDNYTLGRPVWKRHGVPVTLFPAIAPIESGEWLWWDELQKIIGEATLDAERVRTFLGALDEISPRPDGSGEPRLDVSGEQFAQYLFTRMIDLPAELRDLVLDELGRHLGTTRPSRPASLPHARGASESAERLYLNWDELEELADEGVEIGGHTTRHSRLPRESAAVAEAEIAGCRAVLQKTLQRPVTSFAFPGGFYDTRELNLLRRAGYRAAVTVEKGVNYPDTDSFRLRRLSLSWDDAHHLAFKLAFGDWLFRGR